MHTSANLPTKYSTKSSQTQIDPDAAVRAAATNSNPQPLQQQQQQNSVLVGECERLARLRGITLTPFACLLFSMGAADQEKGAALQRKLSSYLDGSFRHSSEIVNNEFPFAPETLAMQRQYQQHQKDRQLQELFGASYQYQQQQQQERQLYQQQNRAAAKQLEDALASVAAAGSGGPGAQQGDLMTKFEETKKEMQRKRAMMGGAPTLTSPPMAQMSHQVASNVMLRTSRSQRQYDVPQIGEFIAPEPPLPLLTPDFLLSSFAECPPAMDGMERFACPTPDIQGRYRCIDDHVLCDGFVDCPEGEDEDRQACMFYKTVSTDCPPPFEVPEGSRRPVLGRSGKLEVLWNGLDFPFKSSSDCLRNDLEQVLGP